MSHEKEQALASIHDLLALHFLKVLNEGEDRVSKDGVFKADPTAATLREMRQFLADNEIDARRTAGSPLDRLANAQLLPFPVKTSKAG